MGLDYKPVWHPWKILMLVGLLGISWTDGDQQPTFIPLGTQVPLEPVEHREVPPTNSPLVVIDHKSVMFDHPVVAPPPAPLEIPIVPTPTVIPAASPHVNVQQHQAFKQPTQHVFIPRDMPNSLQNHGDNHLRPFYEEDDWMAEFQELSFPRSNVASARSLFDNVRPSAGSPNFPERRFGYPPTPRDLGFPPISNTQENWLYDVDWSTFRRRKRRSAAANRPAVVHRKAAAPAPAPRRQEREGSPPAYKQEYEGPYIYTQLFGPPYEVGYIRSPIPSKHVYEDYLQFVRSWSAGSRDAVDEQLRANPAAVDAYKSPSLKDSSAAYSKDSAKREEPYYNDEPAKSAQHDSPLFRKEQQTTPAAPVYKAEESYPSPPSQKSPATTSGINYHSPQVGYEAPDTEFRPSKPYHTTAAGAKSPVYLESGFTPIKGEPTYDSPSSFRPVTASEAYAPTKPAPYQEPQQDSYDPPAYDILKPFENYSKKNNNYEPVTKYKTPDTKLYQQDDDKSYKKAPAYEEPYQPAPAPAYPAEESYKAPAYKEEPYQAPAPAYKEPDLYKAPIYQEESYKQPAKDDSYKVAVVYKEPTKAPAVYKEEEPYQEPVYKAPTAAYKEETYEKPSTYKEESYKAPAPVYKEEEPSYERPSNYKEESYKTQSVPLYKEEPVYEKPSSYKEESYKAPTPVYKEEPSYEKPYKEESYKAPAPVYKEEPSYEKPSSYKEESYKAPVPVYKEESSYEKVAGYRGEGYKAPAPAYMEEAYEKPSTYKEDSYKAPASSYEEESYGKKTSVYKEEETYKSPAPVYKEDPYEKDSYKEETPYKAPAPAYAEDSYTKKTPAYQDGSYKESVLYKEAPVYKEEDSYDKKASSDYKEDPYKEAPKTKYHTPTRYVEPPPYETSSNSYVPSAPKYEEPSYDKNPSAKYSAPASSYPPPTRQVEPPPYPTAGKAAAQYGVPTKDSAYPSGNKYAAPSSGDGYKEDVSSYQPSYEEPKESYAHEGYSRPPQKESYEDGRKTEGNSKDYASSSDINSAPSYETPSASGKKHYPVIIGRYQVTDSRAFLPKKVGGEDTNYAGQDSHASGSKPVSASGTHVHGANGEEYVVYYLPYGQPLPVPIRRRKRSSDGIVYLRSLADRSRSYRNQPEDIEQVLSPEDVHQNLAIDEPADTSADIQDVPSEVAEVEPVSELVAEHREEIPISFDYDSELPSVTEPPQDSVDIAELPSTDEELVEEVISQQQDEIQDVQEPETGVSAADFTSVNTEEQQQVDQAHIPEAYYPPPSTESSSRVLPGLTQRPVEYIKPPGLADEDDEHWNGYSTWWTKLGNRIAKIYRYER